ncbi:NADP-dependent oxidoreductase domain-containing protein [Mucidula mucida]|nr:NADP-dependent oxidoreductase domain-containing protein [Mucidula mucida]
MLSFTLNDGNTIPWVAFGTGTALFGQDAAKSVTVAINNGMTHLDGAQVYRNEQSLGDGIKACKKSRSDLFITTKLKEGETRPVKETLVESLQKLGVDYVDLFLIHSPHPVNKAGGLPELWKQMEDIKKDGLAKSIGVSNFRAEDLQAVLDNCTIVPAVNQFELHPYVWDAAESIYKLCKEKGIVPASYGGLTPIVRASGGPVDSVIAGIVTRLEKESGKPVSPGQVLTKWLIQKGAIVVTTTSKPERIVETLSTPDVPDLTAEEIAAIETEGSKLHKRIFMKHVFE